MKVYPSVAIPLSQIELEIWMASKPYFHYKIFGIAHVLVWLQTEKQNFTWILALPAFQCYQILV